MIKYMKMKSQLATLIIGLNLVYGCQGQGLNKENYQDDLLLHADTIHGYIFKYCIDTKTGLREGQFESFYFSKGVNKGLACRMSYKSGKPNGDAYFYIPNEKLVTRYENITFLDEPKTFQARIFVYDLEGNLKEEGDVQTSDEGNITIIMDDASCCFRKINLDKWKYY